MQLDLSQVRSLLADNEVLIAGNQGREFEATAQNFDVASAKVVAEELVAIDIARIMLGAPEQSDSPLFDVYEKAITQSVGHCALVIHRAEKKGLISIGSIDMSDPDNIREYAKQFRVINGLLGIETERELLKPGSHPVVRNSPEDVEFAVSYYRDNPNINPDTIKTFFMDRKNPLLSLEAIERAISELAEEYKDDDFITLGIIKKICLGNKNPENAIFLIKEQYKKLSDQYADDPVVDARMIRKAVIFDKDPSQSVVQMKKRVEALLDQYKDSKHITPGIIANFVVRIGKSAEKRLSTFDQDFEYLTAQYPDIQPSTIKVALCAGSDPSLWLENYSKTFNELLDKYADDPLITEGVIREFVGLNRDPEAAIEQYKTDYAYIFDITGKAVLAYAFACLGLSREELDNRLIAYIEKVDKLIAIYSVDEVIDESYIRFVAYNNDLETNIRKIDTFKDSVIKAFNKFSDRGEAVTLGAIKALARSNTDLDTVVELHIQNFEKLTERYSGDAYVTPSEIRMISSKYPRTAEQHVQAFRNMAESLAMEFPGIPRKIISQACSATNPRESLLKSIK